MPQSLARIVIHIVFSTKNRLPLLSDCGLRRELDAYQAVILRELDCPAIKIRCVSDHAHILCNLSRNLKVCDLQERNQNEFVEMDKKKRRGAETVPLAERVRGVLGQ